MEESPSLYETSAPQISTSLPHDDAYVLAVENLPRTYAVSVSSPFNEIVLLDKGTLRQVQTFAGHAKATTSIRAVDNVVSMRGRTLLSTGKDGTVKVWDERSGSHAIKLTNLENTSRGVLCCDASYDGLTIVGGTELVGDDALILYWDPRRPIVPLRIHSSTHSNDVTTLSFEPIPGSSLWLLSGSTDGLLSISDGTEDDEDEAVTHSGPWSTSISQAGWFLPNAGEKTPGVWAASDMETFSIWSHELDQYLSMDIRNPSIHTQSRTWVTDYLIKCTPSANGGLRIYTGSNEGDAALITPPEIVSPRPKVNAKGNWALHSSWTKQHSGVVRSILADDENNIIVTGGEDGKIHAWNNPSPFPPNPPWKVSINDVMDMDISADIDDAER